MSSLRRPWDFGYVPIRTAAGDDDGGPCDVIVATLGPLAPKTARAAIAKVVPGATVTTILEQAPLFWTRIRADVEVTRREIAECLGAHEIPSRYVASAMRRSLVVTPPLLFSSSMNAPRPEAWAARHARPIVPDPKTEGRWFLGENGLSLDRSICGTGAGMRLAVIDDSAAEFQQTEADAVLVGIDELPSTGMFHGPLMIGWAVGSKTFRGVAPDASPRLYCIPKPGVDVFSLPIAIVRSVHDGADVVMCATYAEGSTCPMLDDALEFAAHAGRRGRGTPVVFPTGREASSPGNSVHSSWTLGLGEPASDPRVMCIAPGGISGGWFLWKGRKDKFRPFANRGPAVRWLAPGDDVTYPFEGRERPFHAESSGASALAAGALLLVLANNRSLRVSELTAIVDRALDSPRLDPPLSHSPIADPQDLWPLVRDRDGHDAKHGYGRLNVTRACIMAADPVAMALAAIGEDRTALSYTARRRTDPRLKSAYSRGLSRWVVRAMLRDPRLSHALAVIVRHARLVAGMPDRHAAHGHGAMLRQIGLLLRALGELRGVRGTASARRELANLGNIVTSATEIRSDAQAALEAVIVAALIADADPPNDSETEGSGARFGTAEVQG